MEQSFKKIRNSLVTVQAIVFLIMAGTSLCLSGQVKTDETVIQKATEQFGSIPLIRGSPGAKNLPKKLRIEAEISAKG